MKDLSCLFLSKPNNPYTKEAADYIRSHFHDATIFLGTRHDKLPADILNWKGDLLVSFISHWVLPASLLNNVKQAINFHPGSPAYPGTGCTNFAIYNGEKEYGVTCHYMNAKVDAGNIIDVVYFPVEDDESVYSLTQKSYGKLLEQFYGIMDLIQQEKPLPVSTEKWERKPYTRKELNELCYVSPEMSEEEVNKRIRATTYDKPWAYTKIGNHVFNLKE
jgi:methionyl-tRNA formyltransferase